MMRSTADITKQNAACVIAPPSAFVYPWKKPCMAKLQVGHEAMGCCNAMCVVW